MDNKAIIFAELREFCIAQPGYTMAEIIFSIVNPVFHEGGKSLESFKNLTDLELYKKISKSKNRERNE